MAAVASRKFPSKNILFSVVFSLSVTFVNSYSLLFIDYFYLLHLINFVCCLTLDEILRTVYTNAVLNLPLLVGKKHLNRRLHKTLSVTS